MKKIAMLLTGIICVATAALAVPVTTPTTLAAPTKKVAAVKTTKHKMVLKKRAVKVAPVKVAPAAPATAK